MDKKIFAETKRKIARYVNENRLRDAFGLARSLSEGVGAAAGVPGVPGVAIAALRREIASAEEGYRYMLEYAARGLKTPVAPTWRAASACRYSNSLTGWSVRT